MTDAREPVDSSMSDLCRINITWCALIGLFSPRRTEKPRAAPASLRRTQRRPAPSHRSHDREWADSCSPRRGTLASRSPSRHHRETAEFRALIRQHDDANVDALIEMRDHDDNPWVRLAAIQILFAGYILLFFFFPRAGSPSSRAKTLQNYEVNHSQASTKTRNA